MKSLITSRRIAIPVFLSLFLMGCFATQAQWMAYVMVDPDALNEVMLDGNGNVVHLSEQDDGVHLTTFDGEGLVLLETVLDLPINAIQQAVELPNQQLLLVGETLSGSWLVDSNLLEINPFDVTTLALGMGDRPIAGVSTVLGEQIAVYGSFEDQGWVLLIDFAGAASQLLDVSTTQGINSVFGYEGLILEVVTDSGRQVISLAEDLTETGRFVVSSANEELIGDSNGRPALFNKSNHDVKVVDTVGAVLWTFENSELETVDGSSVGPDGSVVLWGDDARMNLLGINFDNVHLLRVDAEGVLAYHYLGGGDMVNIAYTNVKQFDNGLVQISFQGWTGEVGGLLLGSNLGTPFNVTKRVYHDFVTAAGTKTRWMREPKRLETYSQCGSLCVSIISSTEGHCKNLDVFNIDSKSLISLSQVCGMKDENDVSQSDVVKVVRY